MVRSSAYAFPLCSEGTPAVLGFLIVGGDSSLGIYILPFSDHRPICDVGALGFLWILSNIAPERYHLGHTPAPLLYTTPLLHPNPPRPTVN